MTSLRAINGLFDDVDHQCYETHMMSRALLDVFERAMPNSPSSIVAAPGYVAVTLEDRELLSFLVSSLVMCARNMKVDFKELESVARPGSSPS
ncbi:hypothetical protein MesoLj113c_14440 [Mesorhizobium sp. 113-3-9]|uniref:hypothetical protein n=1 Tax=Mesorhizobium sp. 113-3-9 TaxID=2744517 RepID=UPI0019292062|nr:hypothetical protein [Mesorhizobium sp. 113-3-9]BCG85334.1 hypothetical protein MesoLj113c_14440 [Mesorhizobium sp. 113-3-9]